MPYTRTVQRGTTDRMSELLELKKQLMILSHKYIGARRPRKHWVNELERNWFVQYVQRDVTEINVNKVSDTRVKRPQFFRQSVVHLSSGFWPEMPDAVLWDSKLESPTVVLDFEHI